jgi:hypothetical protein
MAAADLIAEQAAEDGAASPTPVPWPRCSTLRMELITPQLFTRLQRAVHLLALGMVRLPSTAA